MLSLGVIHSRRASSAARRQMASMSAPLRPGVRLASSSTVTSGAIALPRVWTAKIARRSSSSGYSNSTTRSKRPGRSKAGSINSGRLVAPSTMTPSRPSMPSISVSSWAITPLLKFLSTSPERLGASESISSKKTIQGAACLACRKTSRIPFSASPTHLESSSGPLIEMKLASHWFANARAISVFPDPGGPDSSTPRGGSALTFA